MILPPLDMADVESIPIGDVRNGVPRVLGFFSSLNPRKGLAELVEALAHLVGDGRDVVLKVHGDGPPEEIRAMSEREERRLIRTGDLSPSFWERLGRSGQVMLALAGVILVGAGAAWFLTGQDDGSTGAAGGGSGGGKASSGVNPGKVSVAVLNGTGGAEAGLAAEYAGFLEQKGFRLGATADAPETFEDSVVFFARGNQQAAELVASEIDADQTELVPSEIASLAPGADVIAVIGVNHSDLPATGS